ncbi:MAG: ATP-binding cassette domain-containing protein, partial [Chloroflexota bacterium]|nr:ATP-binding cassette domain-containing protein [Chloroflexota bacterium]
MGDRTIVADDLVKRFGNFTAVDGVSFNIASGEVYGFLGPNGAGKSTIISMLTTLSLPTSGRATVGGYDVATQANAVRRVAGVALQEIGLDPLMKSLELLTLQCRTFGQTSAAARKRAHDLLDLVKLSEFTDRRVGKYSGGMRRRLDLAMALAHEPEVLFLDEPTTGLDPASRRDIWGEVRRLNSGLGITIFLTTQYLEEADLLANRVAIINEGKIAVEGRPSDLKAKIGTDAINLTFADGPTALRAKNLVDDVVVRSQIDGEVLRLYLPNAAEAVLAIVNRLQSAGITPLSLTLAQP